MFRSLPHAHRPAGSAPRWASSRCWRSSALERGAGRVWRVDLRWAGEDPRLALRSDVSEAGLAEARVAVDALDARSRSGPWAWAYLRCIRDHPGVRAPDLAARFGVETKVFKLGLTISLSPGYRLSPRGIALLALLPQE